MEKPEVNLFAKNLHRLHINILTPFNVGQEIDLNNKTILTSERTEN